MGLVSQSGRSKGDSHDNTFTDRYLVVQTVKEPTRFDGIN
jgi:hypothetical protein